jgi:DNA-binding SARP family transcriptional activator
MFMLEIAGTPVPLPIHAQRVLAFLAVANSARGGCRRSTLAERLWSDVPLERAHASLRTALWRIRLAHLHLVHTFRDTIRLSDQLQVDVHESLDQAERLLSDRADLLAGDTRVTTLAAELLPGWEEDWLLLERERVRQVQLHALEALAYRLRCQGRYAQALDAAFVAIEVEPLRESAHTTLIEIHLAEGNVANAYLQFDRYVELLWRELRLSPSDGFLALLGHPAGSRPYIPQSRARSAQRHTMVVNRTSGNVQHAG